MSPNDTLYSQGRGSLVFPNDLRQEIFVALTFSLKLEFRSADSQRGEPVTRQDKASRGGRSGRRGGEEKILLKDKIRTSQICNTKVLNLVFEQILSSLPLRLLRSLREALVLLFYFKPLNCFR